MDETTNLPATIQDLSYVLGRANPMNKKIGTYKEYVVSYRIWGIKDVVVDTVSIAEDMEDIADIDRKVAENRNENPRNCNWTEKVYVPAYDANDNFYWKLQSDKQYSTSGSCSSTIKSTIGEDLKSTTVKNTERVSTRKNVYMILLENTIAIDMHRITTKFPKWDAIRDEILEYEQSQGLDLNKVRRVLLLNMFII